MRLKQLRVIEPVYPRDAKIVRSSERRKHLTQDVAVRFVRAARARLLFSPLADTNHVGSSACTMQKRMRKNCRLVVSHFPERARTQ